jgi:hypothetical protein
LESDNWVIVGLDSAYFSAERRLYMEGSLGPDGGTQVMFMQDQVAKGKEIIVLTHHNGFGQKARDRVHLLIEELTGKTKFAEYRSPTVSAIESSSAIG